MRYRGLSAGGRVQRADISRKHRPVGSSDGFYLKQRGKHVQQLKIVASGCEIDTIKNVYSKNRRVST